MVCVLILSLKKIQRNSELSTCWAYGKCNLSVSGVSPGFVSLSCKGPKVFHNPKHGGDLLQFCLPTGYFWVPVFHAWQVTWGLETPLLPWHTWAIGSLRIWDSGTQGHLPRYTGNLSLSMALLPHRALPRSRACPSRAAQSSQSASFSSLGGKTSLSLFYISSTPAQLNLLQEVLLARRKYKLTSPWIILPVDSKKECLYNCGALGNLVLYCSPAQCQSTGLKNMPWERRREQLPIGEFGTQRR